MAQGLLYYVNVGAAFLLLSAMAILLGRLLGGPTLYDRVLAVNSFGTKTVLFLCVFALVIGRSDGVDIAILYALMNFIATVAVLKFFRYGTLNIGLRTAHIDGAGAKPSRRKIKTPTKGKRKQKTNKKTGGKKTGGKRTGGKNEL